MRPSKNNNIKEYAKKHLTVHTILRYYMYRRLFMRTTLELPDILVAEAMEITNISTKTEVIKTALENLIQREKVKELADYFGKIDLGINIEEMRKR
ncbi:conserved hypothetical protein [Leadbettera azotonutricia ZAS-9]|nr:conserved hypothetical protein [Leadbettera azotonutricia ZAS-9]